jgi:hypothetical protein
MADDSAALAVTGNDNDFIWCRLNIGHAEEDQESDYNDCNYSVKKNGRCIHM